MHGKKLPKIKQTNEWTVLEVRRDPFHLQHNTKSTQLPIVVLVSQKITPFFAIVVVVAIGIGWSGLAARFLQ